MTATRDRSSDLDEEPAGPAWDERPIFGNVRGLPWWAAVVLAFGVSGIAAFVDVHRLGSLGRIYQAAYVLSCVLAVALVRRRNLFGPMVQPPLVFAVTAIGAIVVAQPGSPLSGGLKALIFSVALPLTSNFPTMGITTAVVVVIGVLRLFLQRDPEPRVRPSRSARGREALDNFDAKESRRTRPGDRTPDGTADRRGTAGRTSERSTDRGSARRVRPDADGRGRPSREADRYGAEDRWEETPRPPRAEPPTGQRPRGGGRRPPGPPDPPNRR